MEYVVIGIVVIVIGVVIANAILTKKATKNLLHSVDEYLKSYNEEYTLTYLENDTHEIDLKINNHHFAIKVVLVPAYSEIQINNQSTWEVKYGAGNTPGKVQPHKRYLTEVSSFMRRDFDEDIEKIVIFSPKPKKIVKYINECEIVFVNAKTDVYGARIFTKENYITFRQK